MPRVAEGGTVIGAAVSAQEAGASPAVAADDATDDPARPGIYPASLLFKIANRQSQIEAIYSLAGKPVSVAGTGLYLVWSENGGKVGKVISVK